MTRFGKTVVLVIILFLAIGGFLLFRSKSPQSDIAQNIPEEETLCYYYSNKTLHGLYDRAWLETHIVAGNVTGEFTNYPAETGSKMGTFTGTVAIDGAVPADRTLNLWWDSLAEGTKATEELIVDLNDSTAHVNFGEMIDRGDGVYIYKEKTKPMAGPTLLEISCDSLDQIEKVEDYLRANIGTIATDKPVLGGRWYVASLAVDPGTKTGTVVYEDGHIQSTASFEYEYDNLTKTVIIKNFHIIKS